LPIADAGRRIERWKRRVLAKDRIRSASDDDEGEWECEQFQHFDPCEPDWLRRTDMAAATPRPGCRGRSSPRTFLVV